jgi:hypothetical protein
MRFMFYFHYNCEKIEERQNAEQKKSLLCVSKRDGKKKPTLRKRKNFEGQNILDKHVSIVNVF